MRAPCILHHDVSGAGLLSAGAPKQVQGAEEGATPSFGKDSEGVCVWWWGGTTAATAPRAQGQAVGLGFVLQLQGRRQACPSDAYTYALTCCAHGLHTGPDALRSAYSCSRRKRGQGHAQAACRHAQAAQAAHAVQHPAHTCRSPARPLMQGGLVGACDGRADAARTRSRPPK